MESLIYDPKDLGERQARSVERIFEKTYCAQRSALDNRPIAERVETLRYRLGVPKANSVEFTERVIAGEPPEEVAGELSAWESVRKGRVAGTALTGGK